MPKDVLLHGWMYYIIQFAYLKHGWGKNPVCFMYFWSIESAYFKTMETNSGPMVESIQFSLGGGNAAGVYTGWQTSETIPVTKIFDSSVIGFHVCVLMKYDLVGIKFDTVCSMNEVEMVWLALLC